ncbi:MAG: zinc ribbon domain-containing protein [Bradyrhizobiaceae bacterium]|nr:MAG: zinc ribbon domain-containing protein [Bradyrhizobiaceae bacterium]
MAQRMRYHCLNCGNEFEAAILTPEEEREARRRNEPISPVICPRCRRRDLRKISN